MLGLVNNFTSDWPNDQHRSILENVPLSQIKNQGHCDNGGSNGRGNVSPAAEFNYYVDP